jgi:hypothetical protein
MSVHVVQDRVKSTLHYEIIRYSVDTLSDLEDDVWASTGSLVNVGNLNLFHIDCTTTTSSSLSTSTSTSTTTTTLPDGSTTSTTTATLPEEGTTSSTTEVLGPSVPSTLPHTGGGWFEGSGAWPHLWLPLLAASVTLILLGAGILVCSYYVR